MLAPMSPTDSIFLWAETRGHPMQVGGLQLFAPPDGADPLEIRALFEQAMSVDAAPLFRKRPHRSLVTLGQWAWEPDPAFELDHHVRRDALPAPGRVRELLELCSRLHSTLLDRRRPLWEVHLVEGLADGRYALYFKVHHALVDGISALRVLSRTLSPDIHERGMPPPWAPRPAPSRAGQRRASAPRDTLALLADAVGVGPALVRAVNRAVTEQGGMLSLSAPKSILNVPITNARRFAAQSWPLSRIRAVGAASDTTVNDVVLALCSGALRRYLQDLDALPEAPLIAMVPVSLHGEQAQSADGGGNSIGAVMCNLGTQHADAACRLATIHESMAQGKAALHSMPPVQILALTALAIAPLGLWPLLRLTGTARPPFNLVISNVPGPREPRYWNGARLDGLYPLSIPLDGQALNITCTSYSDEIAFGLTGCRRTVPHLQRLLHHLDCELGALEQAVR